MKKINSILKGIIVFETILVIIFYILGDSCGSLCDPHSLLNPLGIRKEEFLCPAVCAYTPHPLFYVFADVAILTAIIWGINFLLLKKRE